MGIDEHGVFSAGWFRLACTRRPGGNVAGEARAAQRRAAQRAGVVVLVLLRHGGNGGCKLGFRGTGEGRAADGQRSTNLHDIRRATRRLEI